MYFSVDAGDFLSCEQGHLCAGVHNFMDPRADGDRKITTMFLLHLDGLHRSYFYIITDTFYLLTS